MYKLYIILKDHSSLPTNDELAIASTEKVLDAEVVNAYFREIEASTNLLSMFTKQS